MEKDSRTVLAIAAHPDDIEFHMTGTLILLKRIGYELHYFNVSSGNCGSSVYDSDETARLRLDEAMAAAKVIGSKFHPPICNDFDIFYERRVLKQITNIVRKIKPTIVLTHSPVDYMEDHINTCRLAVTATFIREARNYKTDEPALSNTNCAMYHALPHGLVSPLREEIQPEIFIDTSSIQSIKRDALQLHRTQHEWLKETQSMNSIIESMDSSSKTVGEMSGIFTYAEGWRRRLHLGFSGPGFDPLKELGEYYFFNKNYIA